MKTSLWKFAIITGLLLATLTGCKDDGPSSKIFVRNGERGPIRIAVLPFESIGRQEDSGTVLTNTVVAYLLSTNVFEVVEPGVLDDAMSSAEGGPFRTVIEAMKLKNLQTIQKMLNVDAVIVGTVEEFGEVRVGNDTYPSVSFSARLVDARTGNIVWMGSISKTGADKVTLFDIGRVSSMGKLCKAAVRDMASSMMKSQRTLTLALKPTDNGTPSPADAEKQKQAQAIEHGTSLPVVVEDTSAPKLETAPTPAVANVNPAPPVEQPAVASGRSTDESKTYGKDELSGLLGDVSGYKHSEVKYAKHYHDSVETRYTIGSGPSFVDIKLIDYRKTANAGKFVAHYHQGETAGQFRNHPAYISTNDKYKYVYIDLSVGRFGLFIKGPEAKRADIEKLTEGLINLIQ